MGEILKSLKIVVFVFVSNFRAFLPKRRRRKNETNLQKRNLAQILSYPYYLKPCKKFLEILFVAFELGVSIQSPFVPVKKGQI